MPTRSQKGKTIHDNALADIQNADAKTVIATLSANDLADLLHWCDLRHCTDTVCQAAAQEQRKANMKAKAAAANGGSNTIKLRNADVGMTPEEGDEAPQFS